MSATVEQPAEAVQLRQIPLSRIVIPDGFNPRGQVADDRELEQLAESIRRHGILQPIRVRATEQGDFLLVAGERRYRAAVKAAMMELPAIVRPAGLGDEDEQALLLCEAVIENDQRSDLDPLARALGYRRLVEHGLTVKGVAEQLSTTQARVREHLQILKLPDPLQQQVGQALVPLRAVKPLVALAKIHPGLAQSAAEQVLQPGEDEEPLSWADLERNPLDVALAGKLPDGVYATHAGYSIDAFDLTVEARTALAAIERMTGRAEACVYLRGEEIEQARALGAAHGENWQTIIVGHDVASQLISDQLVRRLKEYRARQRRERELERRRTDDQTAAAAGDDVRATDGGGRPGQDDEKARRAQREADRRAREQAVALNLELGRTTYTELSRVKVDERALKILSSIDVTGKLSEIAMRGARYGFPGWVTEQTQKNGNTKHVYLDRHDACQRAGEYLARASGPAELVGRQLALIVMAVYADQDAVAQSNRSWHTVTCEGPWAQEVPALIDELVADKLLESTLALLRPVLEQRRGHREEQAARRKTRDEALARLEGAEERIEQLDRTGLEQIQQDLDAAWNGWDERQSKLRQLVRAREAQLNTHEGAQQNSE